MMLLGIVRLLLGLSAKRQAYAELAVDRDVWQASVPPMYPMPNCEMLHSSTARRASILIAVPTWQLCAEDTVQALIPGGRWTLQRFMRSVGPAPHCLGLLMGSVWF